MKPPKVRRNDWCRVHGEPTLACYHVCRVETYRYVLADPPPRKPKKRRKP